MTDIRFHGKNLCSIAEIDNNFSGRSIIRRVLNEILRNTVFAVVEAERPYYEIELSVESISNISTGLENLKIASDLFSIRFNYSVKQDNDLFIESVLNIWFEYEQPSFTFLVHAPETGKNNGLFFERGLKWEDMISSFPCYVLFRSAEENVIWVGNSDELKFQGVYL